MSFFVAVGDMAKIWNKLDLRAIEAYMQNLILLSYAYIFFYNL